ncbi:MAG: UDP-N-acetylmuramoyl-L-alanine--D-glutamate ligase [Sulfurovum sp.]|nr:UDP-N-acetylmuramoyl-L-alanine--D-glutamate ligase [Sulfurovum sp.]MCB4748897.1 UDP-N-acetylmuramoyl-L-alanine--D-glutamate ligase [Sulfurovum sp.]MCB4750774.1 UDP-N-acetylmuramoyl-L-alanine--D-glutamate ligase [Sulfurovum sp.]MCB4751636.1 UDP-N-acetylmuramoyl-L-alanine--D-glutamate ligase [Sulfurovum sp.]MCB4753129.1 UDP-N-acetylmuramoyl-L-alanine--D-glutamate ligase [Sulfurovum sp.]
MKPILFGYGLTTKAIAKNLGGGCTFYDDNCKEVYTDEMGNIIRPSITFSPDDSKFQVTTPSLPPKHPLIQKAKYLMSEYDYFLGKHENISSTCHPFTIWISGTNGKTTTTQMLTHLLSKRGAISGGNIGIPLANLNKDAPIWILETSSFTLHHTKTASPNIYLLLPITPDHLDWHGTPKAYEADKLRPLLTMGEGELALVPKGLNLPQTDAFVVEYDSNEFLCNYFDLNAFKLHYRGAFLQDALLSLAITKVLFDEVNYDLLNTFTRDAHRQEEFTDKKGRLWVNDSKATNLDATIQAVKGYGDKYIHLILGGDDKGINLTPLFELLHTMNVTVYSIGANSKKIKVLAEKFCVTLQEAGVLKNAIAQVDKLHTKESVALLSPAAASFDQFDSYKQRGTIFMSLVQALSK